MQEAPLAVIAVLPGTRLTADAAVHLYFSHDLVPHAPAMVVLKVAPIRRQQEEDDDASDGPQVGSLEQRVIRLETQNLLVPRG